MSTKLNWTQFRNSIDGKLESTSSTRHSFDPATGEAGPEVPLVTKQDVERSMNAAQAAYVKWSEVPYAERQKAVMAYADALEAEKEAFAHMLTREQGKPVLQHSLSFDMTRSLTATSLFSPEWSWTLLFIG
jgi:acyl-CoA reductase-like NAD-dependent aldehyde dehydrogenase